MSHTITDETKAALLNWGRWCRCDYDFGLGYPKVQPMFLYYRTPCRDSDDTKLPAIDDSLAIEIEETIKKVCPTLSEKYGIWLYYVERPATWAKLALILQKKTGQKFHRASARDTVQRAEARIDALIRSGGVVIAA